MTLSPVTRVAAVCLTMLAASLPAAAQRAASRTASPERAGGRVPPGQPLDVAQVPAPLRAGASESLRRLVAAARRNSAFDNPSGVDAQWTASARDAPGSAQRAPVTFAVRASLRTRTGARPAQGAASFDVYANAIEPVLASDVWRPKDEHDAQFYLEPARDGSVGGFPHYRSSGMVVMTRIARALWVPVSRERVIRFEIRAKRAFIAQLTGPGAQQLRHQVRQQSSDSALQEWRRQRPQRERAFQQAYAQAKKRDPVYAERLRVSHERMEAEYEKQMREAAAQMPAIDQATGDNKLEAEKCIRLLEEHLASLSPAGRAAPAAISVSLDAWTKRNALAWSRGCSTVAAAPGRETRLIVEPNPDFFDRSQPRSAIQLIIVDTDFVDAGDKAGVPRSLQDRIFPSIKAGVDWEALAALISGR